LGPTGRAAVVTVALGAVAFATLAALVAGHPLAADQRQPALGS
jgi:hypothetical protein